MNRTEHLLTVLAEEGGEVSKECHKALRFGLQDKLTLDPNGPRGTEGPTNAEKIHAEMVDMLAAYMLASEEGLVPPLGITITSAATQERVLKKIAKVEAYLGYAKRVDTLNVIPKLSSMACFRGTVDKPFRMMIEGPQGFSMIAEAKTVQDLGKCLNGAKETFPPNYTRETLPKFPTPALLIHPDYHEKQPPIVTAFGNQIDAMGQVRIQWPDGSNDLVNVEDLRPVFA